MKIKNEQLEALLRQQEQSSGTIRKSGGQSSGFEAALAEQLGLVDGGASSTAYWPSARNFGTVEVA